jgi:hypothetical protein
MVISVCLGGADEFQCTRATRAWSPAQGPAHWRYVVHVRQRELGHQSEASYA